MGLAILKSRAQLGVLAPDVTIEVFLSGGLPTFSIVGLPETAVRESKDRVRGAISSCNFEFPQERIIVSLGPADMKKSGGRFDLPIALGILAASNQIPSAAFPEYEFFGELALSGDIRAVPGVLPAALKAAAAGRSIVVPCDNGIEAAMSHAKVLTAQGLLEVTAGLQGVKQLTRVERQEEVVGRKKHPDLSEVRGQQAAKRALEIAAAGGHNILFCGPPGTGKSMLARRLPGILPALSEKQALETAAVQSVLGRPFDIGSWRLRPFRSPHHTASGAALVGGGSDPRPGEISLAHNGVLFLDELPEFSRAVLEVLREPMEAGVITISRAGRQADFPTRFQLVAAMNPCPCGYLGDMQSDCSCSADRVRNYRDKISGPLLDRIDIQVSVGRPSIEALRPDAGDGESSAIVAQRVAAAQAIQIGRAGVCNGHLEGADIEAHCCASADSWQLLERAMDRFALSARAHRRIQRVARTIADLAGAEEISAGHMSEAIGLRHLNKESVTRSRGL